MKKNDIEPKFEVIKLDPSQFLCESGGIRMSSDGNSGEGGFFTNGVGAEEETL